MWAKESFCSWEICNYVVDDLTMSSMVNSKMKDKHNLP